MTHYQKLVGLKCYLSPLTSEDAEKITAWENDLEVTLPLGGEAWAISGLERTRAQVNEAIQHQWYVFGVIDLANEALIGRTVLFDVDMLDRRAMFGILIGEKAYWGQGYGQEATRLTLDYAFNLLNLNSVTLGVFDFNRRAIHAYQQVGFKEIGRRRQFRIIAGKKYDLVLMDILAEEFESVAVAGHMEAYR